MSGRVLATLAAVRPRLWDWPDLVAGLVGRRSEVEEL